MGQKNNLQAGGREGGKNLETGGQLSDAFQEIKTLFPAFSNFFFLLISIVVKYSSSKLHRLPKG